MELIASVSPGAVFFKTWLRQVWSLNDAANILVSNRIPNSTMSSTVLSRKPPLIFSPKCYSRRVLRREVQQSEIGPSPAFLSCRFLWFGREEQAPHCESASHFLLQTASRDIRRFDLRSAGSQLPCFCCFKWFSRADDSSEMTSNFTFA